MRIVSLEIKNYRNLDGISIKFHPEINFIIGENNLGKSNLLDLLNILFNKNNFSESDFLKLEDEIKITFSLELSDVEQGLFEDLFDPNDNKKINIVAIQESPDEYINFTHKESKTSISNSRVRCVNYINYDSLRNPSSELSFIKNRGVGRFLNHIILKYLHGNSLEDSDFVIPEKIDDFLREVNMSLQKIKSFKDFSVTAVREENKENLLASLILLADTNNRSLGDLGYGVQFSILITLSILERLLSLSKQRLDRCTVDDSSSSEKCIPILIGLDEPEIHLHPYAQRSLIKYLRRIVSNDDPDFCTLLAEIFQINKLLGQILVVSHSPNILLNDYKQFIRFCKDENGRLIVKSGYEINLDKATEKQLLKNLPYIKEVFFSKAVILVEGDTELGALHAFAEKMEVDLDDFGITIIQAGGAESIPLLMKLLDYFDIKNLGLMDGDKKDRRNYKDIDNLSFTNGRDFEEDIYENFRLEDYIKYLKQEFNSNKTDKLFQSRRSHICDSSEIIPQLNELSDDKQKEIKDSLKEESLKFMKKNTKNVLEGRTIGGYVRYVPEVYKNLIQKIVELSKKC